MKNFVYVQHEQYMHVRKVIIMRICKIMRPVREIYAKW